MLIHDTRGKIIRSRPRDSSDINKEVSGHAKGRGQTNAMFYDTLR